MVNDGNGHLSGYAWAENGGWISFSCENTDSCGAVDYGVTIDAGGVFHGMAWGENIGWINFAPDGVGIKTLWPSDGDTDNDGIPDADELICGSDPFNSASTCEVCDATDNDQDGAVDEELSQGCSTVCGSGTEICEDGEWVNCSAPQAQTEICDGEDNDCDGSIDEDVKSTFYRDADSDGYGDINNAVESCEAPGGYVPDNTDCDDADAAINPGAIEVCNNGRDDNCDDQIDGPFTITFHFVDQNGDLAGTENERVYVEGYGWKADGEQITVVCGTNLSYRVYYKQGSTLCGPWLSHSCTATTTLPVRYQTLTMDFEDQDGDLNPDIGRGTGYERVYIDQVGYKADGEAVSVPLSGSIGFAAKYKEASALSGPKDILIVDDSTTSLLIRYRTLTMDFEDQTADLDPSSGRGTGNERVYIDYVGYKADGESVTLPLSGTINYRAYFSEGSVLYSPKNAMTIGDLSTTLLVRYHTLTMDLEDQDGDLDPSAGRGTGSERVYINYVGYRADGGMAVLPLSATITWRAYFKEGSGLCGPKNTASVDGSSSDLTAHYRRVSFEVRNSVSHDLVTGAQSYVDNAGYVQNAGFLTAPLSSTIYHRANVGSIWSSKVSKGVDSSWSRCVYEWNGATFSSPSYLE